MSILARLNPLRIARTADAMAGLRELGEKLRDDQKTLTRQLRSMARQLEQLEEMLKQQEEALGAIPELQTQMRRCVTAYTEDARQAHLLPALRARLGDGQQIAAHTAAAVARAQLELDPFPHVLIEDLLPDDVCGELIRTLPPTPFFQMKLQTGKGWKFPSSLPPSAAVSSGAMSTKRSSLARWSRRSRRSSVPPSTTSFAITGPIWDR